MPTTTLQKIEEDSSLSPEEILAAKEAWRAKRREYTARYKTKHKERIRAMCKAASVRDKEKVSERGKQYRKLNREKELARQLVWRLANPDKVKAKDKRARIKNHDKVVAATKKWRNENPEKAKAACNAWRAANPERMRAIKHVAEERRRAKLRNCLVQGRGVTVDQWQEQLDAFGHCCAYCQRSAQALDHIVPIFSNGDHSIDNCVPCCKRCNSSKGKKSLLVWLLTSKLAQQGISRSASNA